MRSRYGIGSSVFAAENQKRVGSSFWTDVDKRRRQSGIVIMRQWSGWLSRQTATIERGFWNQKQKRERPDPRRTAAPLPIMRSCTRNYAPRFSGIAKNSRRCTETGPRYAQPVVVVLHHHLARFSFISFRHLPPSPPSSHRIINVTKPGLVADALCIHPPTLERTVLSLAEFIKHRSNRCSISVAAGSLRAPKGGEEIPSSGFSNGIDVKSTRERKESIRV